MSSTLPSWFSNVQRESSVAVLPSWFSEIYKPFDPETKPGTKQARTVGPEKINFSTASRGIRNNNPGNIEIGDPWQGRASAKDLLPHQEGEDRFVVFKSPEFGIRAMTVLLQTYRVKHGLTSIRGIINRWAPPEENDTEAYIESVSEFTGIDPDKRLDTSSANVLNPLVTAIIRQENKGQQPYSETTILTGISLAFEAEEE